VVEKVAEKEEQREEETEESEEDESEDEQLQIRANGNNESDSEEDSDENSEDEDESDDDSGDEHPTHHIDFEAIDDSDSESELDSDEENDKKQDSNKAQNGMSEDKMDVDKDGEDKSGDEEDEEEEIDVEELEPEDEEDEEQIAAGTRTRQTINNKEGLLTALRRIQLDINPKTTPFSFHQSVVASKRTEDSIPQIEDDLQRELAFMNQALEAARLGRSLLRKEGVPFTRPTDYFAEMVRTDATMEKVKQKLIEEATAKKAAAEARKQRDLKKFGKAVQVQKQLERAKQKREALDKINQLKRSMSTPLIHHSVSTVY
jgi:AAA ATPase containing von Willebrand factor type A (vWA) domain